MMKSSHYMLRKICILCIAVLMMAFGAALYFQAGLGSDPVSTLCDGLYRTLGIARGTASMIINGGIFFVFLWIDRRFISLGSVFAAFGVGPFITLFEKVFDVFLPDNGLSLPVRLLLPILGSAAIAFGRALYLPCECGAAPLDMIVLSVGRKSGWPYRISFSVVSGSIFALGLLFHGAWGLGTIVAIFLTGWIADFYMQRWNVSLKRFVGIQEERV
ncbi:hypothetical protein DW651_19515 [Subdoligranulum sp. AM23-21AC]|jgi:uncharacterized membrane protein YczE|uniref:YczE/YyaS/YitT family protein n=1 Tax=Ruthenibacterium lactatiformans TaxID=1550024 RepID=UPI000E3EF865|nr:hypothetical protein [Ruthenibacterium lactatiformans]RGD16436.1 hypothetical protein DW651_19515 [Subdoligranulum sp. AM23-21AC]RJW23857.1 hypothetical protein DXC43_17695 [Subdoligranulum sp. TF05-17AC]